MMEYKRVDNTVVLRLDPGDEIAESILTVAKNEHITAGAVQGIGAVDDLAVGVFDLAEKAYRQFHFTGNREINALAGNLSVKDGAPYLHLHITCTAGDGTVVGGHLFRGVVSLTAEIFITALQTSVNRCANERLGINQMTFD